MKIKKLLGLTTTVVISALILGACGQSKNEDAKVVRVGTMVKSKTEKARWDKIEELVKKKGVKLKFTEFTDYTQPNKANKTNLVSVAETYFTSFRLYSGTKNGKGKYQTVSEIPNKATITIPNDAVNESRSLYLLQSAGLLKLKVSGDTLATMSDVVSNPKSLDLKEVDAAQTARSLDSTDAAVINNDFVTEAGINPKSAIFIEPKSKNAKQWYNLLVAQKGWQDKSKAKAIKEVVKAYHTDAVKKVIEKTSQGLDQPVW
ncbi:TPA: MetQ/NlpA family ABC transporter substrate-binding protein [Streptococcus agalactiae]|uniref:MetQ/NlpA family ABC transporter substrate-binding protein n=1 Tax=Streptococcus agalactiae TaxID=1311 RepID=UPI00064018EB|nr:MetQ/NlpA family ABC transporter substrate-binding protein [Streptococcus agalactiae]KLJ18152.1 O-sialoglycoprotein endopeptidase [Streptococcus agalactiae]HEO0841525.1 MetQ/NlpA family ABC transporter substrate-binding protein [Streptococcus agalactiae]HEO0843524.1 MetQ/NlpA family ABC transporter substrate-binding protein [Streptococcus agalactiae]HEO0845382.1 MetQ/NlpA family ABC transporter substrate-binding protein [Streptococcus agalactiae]HEO4794314.1 MetQ/NlpA family ABC transporter